MIFPEKNSLKIGTSGSGRHFGCEEFLFTESSPLNKREKPPGFGTPGSGPGLVQAGVAITGHHHG
jgi:hypothetical protein